MRGVLVLGALAGCASNSLGDPGCLDGHLERWCLHDELEEGLDVGELEAACEAPEPPSDPDAERCGEYEVTGSSGGYTGVRHYFLDGQHVATQYWTDVNTYCGGFSHWYGERIRDCR